jgi:hypothetical protein
VIGKIKAFGYFLVELVLRFPLELVFLLVECFGLEYWLVFELALELGWRWLG